MTQPPVPMSQAATWKHKIGNNGEDDVYSSTNIICRFEMVSRVVRTIQGDELQCQALMTCQEAVQPGDLITYGGRDYPVLGLVEDATDLDGRTWWRTVTLGWLK